MTDTLPHSRPDSNASLVLPPSSLLSQCGFLCHIPGLAQPLQPLLSLPQVCSPLSDLHIDGAIDLALTLLPVVLVLCREEGYVI